MPRRTLPLLVPLLLVTVVGAADLRTLKNETFKGDLVAANDKEIVFSKGGEKMTLPLTDVLAVDLNPAAKIAPDTKYGEVELTDGTRLRCKDISLRPKVVQVTLLDDRKTEIALSAVGNILFAANVPAYRKDWNERLARKRTKDYLAVRDKQTSVINALEGTLGEASEDGKTVHFTRASDKKEFDRVLQDAEGSLNVTHGLIYNRYLAPEAPPVKMKLTDTANNLIMVSGQNLGEDGLTVTTPSGVKFVYPLTLVSQLDYRTGNLIYLSDMEPSNVRMTSTFDQVYPYRRDRNLDDKAQLRIKGQDFQKGLSVHAYTELEYDLRGDYRAFSCVAGFDDNVGGHPGPVILTIDGDGRELKKVTFDRKDKVKPEEIVVNVKDVQKLRITVSSGELLDMGKHLDLGDARVTK